ncbi:MAG: hypothetical protein WA851_05465 [Xanthobacteraceae bacterium]
MTVLTSADAGVVAKSAQAIAQAAPALVRTGCEGEKAFLFAR